MASTQSNSSQKSDDEVNADILAGLIVKADGDDSSDVCNCLRAYKLKSTQKSNETALNKFSKDVLINTLNFLNVKDPIWKNCHKPDILNELICRIQNLLVDVCHVCNEQFATGIDDKSYLQCELCGQSFHQPCLESLLGDRFNEDMTKQDVQKILNPLNLNGLHYLCNFCSTNTIPETKMTNKVTVSKNSNQNTQLATISETHHNDKVVDLTNEVPWKEREDVCKRFLESRCPHGITGKRVTDGKTCDKFHPKVCKAYRKGGNNSRYGCSKGDDCDYFHPEMCPNSLNSHTCFELNCKFVWHLPHTARHKSNNNRPDFFKNRSGHQTYRNFNSRGKHNQHFRNYQNSNYARNHRSYRDATANNSYNREWEGEGQSGSYGRPSDQNREGVSHNHGNENGHRGEPHRSGELVVDKSTNQFSLPFLVQKLENSIAEKIQSAFQQIDLPNQIQRQLVTLQNSQTTINRSHPQSFQPSIHQPEATNNIRQEQYHQVSHQSHQPLPGVIPDQVMNQHQSLQQLNQPLPTQFYAVPHMQQNLNQQSQHH